MLNGSAESCQAIEASRERQDLELSQVLAQQINVQTVYIMEGTYNPY